MAPIGINICIHEHSNFKIYELCERERDIDFKLGIQHLFQRLSCIKDEHEFNDLIEKFRSFKTRLLSKYKGNQGTDLLDSKLQKYANSKH